MRLIIAITGASGVIMGYRLLQALRQHPDIETHLIISEGAKRNFELETELTVDTVLREASFQYDNSDLAACISSGSFRTDGMVVIPCSMKTLSGIANAYDENLIIRAAGVCLKEGRRLVLVPREMPLSRVHLHNLQLAADYGCRILPPMLTFYNRLSTTEEQVQHIIGKILMQFDVRHDKFIPWREE